MRWMDGLFGKRKREKELEEEVRSHLKLSAQERVERGVDEGEATSAARREFGNVELVKEVTRDVWGWGSFERLIQDFRFGLRMIVKSPGFAAVAILTLALGIGANTALFSVVNGVLLNPLPYPDPEQLVTLAESKPNFDSGSISFPNFRDWRKDNRTFSMMGISRSYSYSLTGRGEAEQVDAEFVSSDYLTLLGVKPVIGRLFEEGEDEIGASPIVLIGEGFWNRKFGAARDISGQGLTLDGRTFTIVGVVPASFKLQVGSFRASDVYAPIGQWTNPLLPNRAAGLGFFLAASGTEVALRNLPSALPRANEIGLDFRVLLFTMAVSLLCGILFGLVPALRISRPNLQETLKEGGRGSGGGKHRAQGVFVVAEMALALVLLIAAGLMIRSLSALWNVNPGFDSHNVLSFGVALAPSTKATSPDAVRAQLRELQSRLASTPGVKAASLSWGALPLGGDDEDLFYLEGQPKPASVTGVVGRFAGDAHAVTTAIRSGLRGMSGEQVMYSVQPMEEVIAETLAERRVSVIVLGAFAALALGLASIGTYGVISYLVGQRTHEIGIRMALGAKQSDVMGLVLREGLKMTALGVVLGLIAAAGLTRLMANLLFGVSATDPLTFAGVAVVLTFVALVACYVPARRAMKVDPIVALRYE